MLLHQEEIMLGDFGWQPHVQVRDEVAGNSVPAIIPGKQLQTQILALPSSTIGGQGPLQVGCRW